jgi:hypothetical protein
MLVRMMDERHAEAFLRLVVCILLSFLKPLRKGQIVVRLFTLQFFQFAKLVPHEGLDFVEVF